MKKLVLASLLTMAAVGANAQSLNFPNSGSSTLWSCGASTGNLGYCTARVVSGTTAASLGSIKIDPSKRTRVILTANNTAVSSLVTTSLVLSLKGRAVGTVSSVSTTSAGNVYDLGTPAWFDAVTISVTQPSAISATNSIQATVTNN